MAIKIEGTCDPKFNRIKDAFAANFEKGYEIGASVAATIDGNPVVDLWAGHADKARSRSWTRDTIANVYSTTKGLTAICAHRLIDQGKLDVDAPVVRYWPEFGRAGKDRLPVRFLLSHRAGLAAVRRPLKSADLFDWMTMCDALAEQEPWWAPGTAHGYHAMTFGFLVGEVIRRITGKSVGSYFRDELATPLGLDAHIGLDAKHDARTAELVSAAPPKPGELDPFAEILKNSESVGAKAFMNPPVLSDSGLVNTRAWRAAELPAANAHTNARALSRLYGAIARGGEVDGYRIFSRDAIPRCYAEQSNGRDEVLLFPTRFSLGFMLPSALASFGPNPNAFGHPGAGGSFGFADPDAKVGFGYVMSQMQNGLLVNERVAPLIASIYESL